MLVLHQLYWLDHLPSSVSSFEKDMFSDEHGLDHLSQEELKMILIFLVLSSTGHVELCIGSHINDSLGSMPESSLHGYCGVLFLTSQLIFHLLVNQAWCLLFQCWKLGHISGLPSVWVVLYLRTLAQTQTFSSVV